MGNTIKPNILFLDKKNVKNENYSGRCLDGFIAVACRFERCQFENMKIQDATFGGGKIQTTYTDCSFDNTKVKIFSGINRFVRCSFRNMDIGELFGLKMEFIDCCFAGAKLRKAVFFATTSDSRRCLDKEFMDFYGNDFSEAKFDDVGFRTGIDFTKQKFPTSDNFIYVYDPAVIFKVKNELLNLPNILYRENILDTINVFEVMIKSGQKHFLFQIDEHTRDENEKREMIELFKRCTEE